MAEGGRQPPGQQKIRKADRMIGVVVREEEDVDPRQRNMKLPKPDCHAAAGIDEQLLIAGLDQGRGAEPVWIGIRDPSAEKRDAEKLGFGARGLGGERKDNECKERHD